MRNILVWLYMLNKRLYKRGSFVVILLLIFASILGFVAVSQEDRGFVHIALTGMPGDDLTSTRLIEKLVEEDSILRFTYMEHPEEGLRAVQNGQVDALWIFPASFAEEDGGERPAVRVVEREQTVFSRLSREKLHGLLFASAAKDLFVSYSRENLPVLDGFTEEELLSYFENCNIDDELFLTEHSEDSSGNSPSANYLTFPLRGLLGLLCVLGGLAGSLYHLQDEEKKVFSNLPIGKRSLIAVVAPMLAALHVGIVSLPALWGSGLYPVSLREVLNTLLLVLCSTAFSMVIGEIFSDTRSFGVMIPTLLIAMSILCPVFLDLHGAKWLSYLFPPTYYIHGGYEPKYLLYGVAYSLSCVTVAQIIRLFKKGLKQVLQ